MREKLLYAARNCGSIDADHTLESVANLRMRDDSDGS